MKKRKKYSKKLIFKEIWNNLNPYLNSLFKILPRYTKIFYKFKLKLLMMRRRKNLKRVFKIFN